MGFRTVIRHMHVTAVLADIRFAMVIQAVHAETLRVRVAMDHAIIISRAMGVVHVALTLLAMVREPELLVKIPVVGVATL